jgi:hypothetical protein
MLFIESFQKRSILPPQRKFLPSGGGGEKKLFLIIVNVLRHPKGVGGLTSYFLRGGGMDVFWNDRPLCDCGALQMSEKWAELVYKLTFGTFYTQFSVAYGRNLVKIVGWKKIWGGAVV